MTKSWLNYKGMYDLLQAGRITYDNLLTHISLGCYIRTWITLGLFKHYTKPITFCNVVNGFGVNSNGRDAINLINHLEKEYKVVTNWEGNLFCGIHLKWDYSKRTVKLCIPEYIICVFI